jgi:hypothetical protein
MGASRGCIGSYMPGLGAGREWLSRPKPAVRQRFENRLDPANMGHRLDVQIAKIGVAFIAPEIACADGAHPASHRHGMARNNCRRDLTFFIDALNRSVLRLKRKPARIVDRADAL